MTRLAVLPTPDDDSFDGLQRGSAVHLRLRQMILSGELPAGAILSQVEMSARLGVSRTPLREALRMLQEEGLVEAEANRRARVAEVSPADLDTVYAQRVLLESLGIALTVPNCSEAELDEAAALLDEMRALAEVDDLAAWHQVHRRFHGVLVGHASAQIKRNILVYAERGERYVQLYQRSRPRGWSAVGQQEHEQIVKACRERDVDLASASLARHLARTALAALGQFSPESDPVATRAAVRLAAGAARR